MCLKANGAVQEPSLLALFALIDRGGKGSLNFVERSMLLMLILQKLILVMDFSHCRHLGQQGPDQNVSKSDLSNPDRIATPW